MKIKNVLQNHRYRQMLYVKEFLVKRLEFLDAPRVRLDEVAGSVLERWQI